MLFSSGMLSLGLVGGVSGLVHCTGATCPAAGLTASVPTAFGFTIGGLGGLAATSGSALFPTFALAGLTVGTVLGFPVSAIFTFTEAPLFGAGLSRHYIARISDLAVVPYGQDKSARRDFRGSDARNPPRRVTPCG